MVNVEHTTMISITKKRLFVTHNQFNSHYMNENLFSQAWREAYPDERITLVCKGQCDSGFEVRTIREEALVS
jgi:hypothetical protein